MTTYGPFITRAQAKTQGLKQYFTGKACKRGHHATRLTSNGACAECSREDCSQFYELNRSTVLQTRANYSATNRQQISEYQKNYRVQKKERLAECNKKYRAKNETRLKEARRHYDNRNRLQRNEKARLRYANDPQYKMAVAMRNSVNERVRQFQATKKGRTFTLVGCSPSDLCAHLEAQFTEGMSWDNYGEWHIDHIRPCASFDLEDPAQQQECFHFTNLQPLWALDNIRKSDTWEPIAA